MPSIITESNFVYWEENIVGKGENACYKHFLLFLKCFQKAPFLEYRIEDKVLSVPL